MITRIVKLSFHQDYTLTFEQNFPSYKKLVLTFEGCKSVALHKSTNDNVFFTISIWESETLLNKYRNSEAFKNLWNEFKTHFNEPAQAWTTFLLEKDDDVKKKKTIN